MSIVLDTKDFGEVRDVKGNVVSSLGEVASTVIGSTNTMSSGSKGNVGSIGNVGSLGNVGSNGNVASYNNLVESGNVASALNVGSTNNVAEPGNLINLAPVETVAVSSGAIELQVEQKPVVYREYAYRFVIMALYFGISNAGAITGSVCAPIITNLTSIYGVSQNVVNLSNLIGMVVYIPATIPGNYILDTWGIKPGVLIGTALMVAGMWVRMLATSSFTFVILGQLLAGLGGPLLCNCPQKISAYWTGPKSRTMFTVLLMLSGTIGGSIGLLLPGYYVGEETDPVKGKALFLHLLLIEAIIATALSAPAFLLFRERPPTPPSASASAKRESFKEGFKSVLKNKSFLWLLGQQGCVLGCMNALATVVQSIVNPFGYNQMQAATLGVIITISAVVGCLVCSIYVEKTKKFRISIIGSSIIGLIFYGIFTGVLYTQNFIALAVVTAILGFVLSPSGPLALEFACEITFPVGEAMSGGIILSVMQLFCPAQTFIVGGIMGMEDQRKAALYCMIMFLCFMAVGIICSFKIKEDLKRSHHDKIMAESHAAAIAAANTAANNNNPETPCPLVNNLEASPEAKYSEASPEAKVNQLPAL